MKLFSARQITPKQQDKYLGRIAEAVVGKDAKEARKALYALHDEVMESIRAQANSEGIDPDDHRLVLMDLDFHGLNDVAMFALFPYTPDFEPGVVQPTGEAFDWTPEERFRFGAHTQQSGQLVENDFVTNKKGPKFVTASVEGFENPVKMRLVFWWKKKGTGVAYKKPRKGAHLDTVLGKAIIDGMRYTWTPVTDYVFNLIDEGKPWSMLGEGRPLSDREKAKLAPKPQLNKDERRQVDVAVLSAIREHNQRVEEDFERDKKAEKSWRGYVESTRQRPYIVWRYLRRWWDPEGEGNVFIWAHDDLSEVAKGMQRDDHVYLRERTIKNSLVRLVRKGTVRKLESDSKYGSEYVIREDYE
jgi:hypothetical protein